MKKPISLSLTDWSRSLRQTIGSAGISGERQITLTFFAASGLVSSSRRMLSVLLVATSTWPLATAIRLVSWLALVTVRKHDFGSMPLAANTNTEGTRKPEVEFGS